MKVFMHLPVNLCEILIPQGTASLEYEDFRIAFSVAINGNSFNCVIDILAMIICVQELFFI